MEKQIIIVAGVMDVFQKEFGEQIVFVESRVLKCVLNDLGRHDHYDHNTLVHDGDLVGHARRNNAEVAHFKRPLIGTDLMPAGSFVNIKSFEIGMEMFKSR